jgi:hypothetical protein
MHNGSRFSQGFGMRANGAVRELNSGVGRTIVGRGRQRGQSLIVAVIVMFVLLFIGAVFVGIVARNLMNSGRARETVSATQFAEAGLKYADQFLQNSPLGADWRPAVVPVANLNPNDPDFNWLARGFTRVEMNAGRALIKVTYRPDLINDPLNPLNKILDPNGKYIKIESVGRVGAVNPNDPTTFLNTPSPRLRREYVAYKQIGLGDYLRWMTNHNNDTKAEAFFGVQPMGVPVFMQLGGLPAGTGYALPPFMKWTGAPMRVNGKLHLGNNLVVALDRRNGDVMQVSDDISVDPEVTGDPTRFRARVNVLEQTNTPNQDPTPNGATKPDPIIPTDGPFNSFGGLIRDGAGVPDIFGYVRAISKLDPPIIDAEDPATGFTRYRLLTRGSGKYLPNPNNPNNPYDLGRIGLGAGVYIENTLDTDMNSTVQDAETLTRTWLSPGLPNSAWNGPYYIAPGVTIQFGYNLAPERDANAAPTGNDVALPGFRAIKNPSASPYFRDLQGQNVSRSELTFTYFIYVPNGGTPVLKLDCDFYRKQLEQGPFNYTDQQIDKQLSDFNGVIFAEGNLKVRGLVPGVQNIPIRREGGANPLTDAQVRAMISTGATLVSNQNIYIESSLLREDPKAMVALLAVQNVAVNATMFTALSGSNLTWSGDLDPIGSFTRTAGDTTNLEFMLGENPAGYRDRNNNQVSLDLLLRHGVDANQSSYVNLFVNQWAPHTTGNAPTGPQPLYYFNVTDPLSPGLPAWTYPLHNATTTQNFEYKAFPLIPKSGDPNNPYYFTADAGYAWPQGLWNIVQPAVDTQYAGGAPGGPYLLGRAAVVPMDVRIEAVMYAQNGKFFIIPGVPINNDLGADSRAQDLMNAQATGGLPAGTMERRNGADQKFPLAGEPMDCRITIVGAIAENQTASASEQAEWMKLWGWIPSSYGTTGHDARTANGTELEIPKGHLFVNDSANAALDMRFQAEKAAAFGGQGLTRGIRFIYDPALYMPYVNYLPTNGIQATPMSFRYDLANFDPANPAFDQDRTLPPIPRLPVCPGFVFSGEVR